MSAFRVDGTFTTASACGAPRLSFPIAGDPTAYIVSQDLMQFVANYTPPTLDGAHSVWTSAFLIGDSDLQDLGGGVVRWTREWASIPANRNEWGSFVYRFIGLLGTSNPPYSQYWTADIGGGRDPRAETVNSRIYHEYFHCKTGNTYETPGAIPTVSKQEYTLDGNPDATFDYLLPASVYWDDSSPTKEAYEALIAAETEIVAEDSTIERYLGNIYVRRTRYVVAQ